MRERVELGFQSEEMRDAGAVAAKYLPEIKFQKMAEQTNDVMSFFNVFEKKTCTLHGIQGQQLARICQVCYTRRRIKSTLVWISTSVDRMNPSKTRF